MAEISKEVFGHTSSNKEVVRYKLANEHVQAFVIDYGATIQSILTPDKHGQFIDIVHGYDTLKDYEDDKCYLGALCGRVANRISKAQFTIDGRTYHLAKNHGEHHIHGGFQGFNKAVWASSIVNDVVRMEYTSQDGEEGYPGTLTTTAEYSLDGDKLKIDIKSMTTAPTPVNIVQHTYFNLAGHTSSNIYDHTLTLCAQLYTSKHDTGLPTGKIEPVHGTAFDFIKPKRLGQDINSVPGDTGYDHNYCIDADLKNPCARLEHGDSGRVLEVFTNQPGLQVYTGNFLCGERGKGGAAYGEHSAICLETQNYPDAVNHDNFPNVILRPGQEYHHQIVYKFNTI